MACGLGCVVLFCCSKLASLTESEWKASIAVVADVLDLAERMPSEDCNESKRCFHFEMVLFL